MTSHTKDSFRARFEAATAIYCAGTPELGFLRREMTMGDLRPEPDEHYEPYEEAYRLHESWDSDERVDLDSMVFMQHVGHQENECQGVPPADDSDPAVVSSIREAVLTEPVIDGGLFSVTMLDTDTDNDASD
jgi:hypothetical protein